jgi:hypothetical protein
MTTNEIKLKCSHISPAELGDGTESNLWLKRRGHLTGYRRKVVCGGNYKAALYEFSVQHDKTHVHVYDNNIIIYC